MFKNHEQQQFKEEKINEQQCMINLRSYFKHIFNLSF